MYVQLTGQPRFRMWAEVEGEFFLRVVDAQLSFVAGAGGATSSLVLHQNGANQPARKR